MSFVIDPPLLVASGAAIARGTDDERVARAARALTLGAFIGVSAGLYANVKALDPLHRAFGSRTGREFMLTSGLARIDEDRMTTAQHAAALAQFALYPAWLALGERLARRS